MNQLTKRVLETALEAEMTEHLGFDTHHPADARGRALRVRDCLDPGG